MTTSLITDTDTNEQTSIEFTNPPNSRFTITGFNKTNSWYVLVQKKFSDQVWRTVRVINNTTPIFTLTDIGTFRLVKPMGYSCIVDKD